MPCFVSQRARVYAVRGENRRAKSVGVRPPDVLADIIRPDVPASTLTGDHRGRTPAPREVTGD
mgnify:CR=1 FL=1